MRWPPSSPGPVRHKLFVFQMHAPPPRLRIDNSNRSTHIPTPLGIYPQILWWFHHKIWTDEVVLTLFITRSIFQWDQFILIIKLKCDDRSAVVAWWWLNPFWTNWVINVSAPGTKEAFPRCERDRGSRLIKVMGPDWICWFVGVRHNYKKFIRNSPDVYQVLPL